MSDGHNGDVNQSEKEAELAYLMRAHYVMGCIRDRLVNGDGTRSLDSVSPVVPSELFGEGQRPVQSVLVDDDEGAKWLLVLIPASIAE